MPKYTNTCQLCGVDFTNAAVCCDNGTGTEPGCHIRGRCVKCCHGEDPLLVTDKRKFKPMDKIQTKNEFYPLHGRFLKYLPNGYAQVGFDPRPEWNSQTPAICVVHPRSIKLRECE